MLTASTTAVMVETRKDAQNCALCLATFESKTIKREHLKCDWHVYNLRRRMASLPSISKSVFQTHILGIKDDASALKTSTNDLPHRKEGAKTQTQASNPPQGRKSCNEVEEEIEAYDQSRCLFCNAQGSTLDDNLTHMSHTHGFFIPNSEDLIDESSILQYLDFVVSSLCECLACGSVKMTKVAVQHHMQAKGHCHVDFKSNVHRLWEFYDSGENASGDDDRFGSTSNTDAEVVKISDGELRLPTGTIIEHRSQRSATQRPRRSGKETILESDTNNEQQIIVRPGFRAVRNTNLNMNVQVARNSTSLIGVSELQQRALVATERNMEKLESRARNEYESKVDRGGNRQKRFRVLTMGKKAGGLEKRLG